MADDKLDYFKLMRDFWDFAFKNPESIKPNHCAVYAYAVEHCNRLGWKEKFGFPTSMVLDYVGIKSYSVYKKTFDDLVQFGFFEVVEYSKNQYSANIIALKENSKAHVKAPIKATENNEERFERKLQSTYQSTLQSTCESTVSIIKQENNINLIKPLKEFTQNEIFGKELLESPSWLETIAIQNKIRPDEIESWIEIFNTKLISEFDNKNYKQDYAGHFSRWLPGEILKSKKVINNGKQSITIERNR
ncbi:hypothetical protein [Flavobacterium sp. 1355]|uniref:DUF7833 domain-containing protein n=1 Tax=Flavobacterium sp. 1355 TaxID=2806571 RepID=UPI001AEAFD2C|nr:hypothetical protein [Flavobacterium sp. 1355]MBP1222616.1 hypothetical protein [Flavobacterium sp. 1355]